MATGELNPILRKLHGQIGNYVFRHVRGKLVVSEAPDWSKRKRTAAQKAASKRFGESARRASAALTNEKAKAVYKKKASKRQIPLAAAAISDFLKQARPSTPG
jgi:hypothetical protein